MTDHVQRFIDLAVTPGGRIGDASPLARPGYTGKRKLTDYEREIAHALMRKRGMSKGHAIAVAKNATRRWARGGGKVRPQVRAGAAASVAQAAALSTDSSTAGDIELSWAEKLHPRGWGGKFIAKAGGDANYRRRKHGIESSTIEHRTAGAIGDIEHHEDGSHTITSRFAPKHANTLFAKPSQAAGAIIRGHREHLATKAALRAAEKPSRKAKARTVKVTKVGRRSKAAPPSKLLRQQQRRAKAFAKIEQAQREQARRIVASQALGVGRAHGRQFGVGSYTQPIIDKRRFTPSMGLSSMSEEHRDVIDLAVREAADRHRTDSRAVIDLSLRHAFEEALHPRDFRGRFAKKGSLSKSEEHRMRGEAQQFLGRHTRAGGMAKLAKVDAKSRKVEAGMAGDTKTLGAAGHARNVLAKVRKSEPKITEDLKSVVGKLGGEMEALMAHGDAKGDFRFKSHASLTRKIRDKADSKYKDMPVDEAQARYASEVGDALRYTALFDSATFTKDVKRLQAEFEARGYKIESTENTFARGQAYSGVNMNVISPDGQRWELQAHTPESIKAKHLIHDDYEIYRSADPSVSEAERRAAYNRMVAVNRQLVRPNNYEKLGTQLHRPDAKRHDEHLIGSATQDLYRRGQYEPRRGRRRLKTA